MDLSFLVGRTITHCDPVTNGSAGWQVVKTRWIVVAAYPHYVQAVRTCENGTVIICGVDGKDFADVPISLSIWKGIVDRMEQML